MRNHRVCLYVRQLFSVIGVFPKESRWLAAIAFDHLKCCSSCRVRVMKDFKVRCLSELEAAVDKLWIEYDFVIEEAELKKKGGS